MPRLRTRSNNLTPSASSSRPVAASNHSMSRPRRGAATAAAATVSATVDREGSSSRSRSASPERKRLRLTVKAAPSKLREATSSTARTSGGRASLRGGRTKKTVVEESSEEEEEEDEEEVDEEDDADGDEDVEMEDEEDDDDAEGEEEEVPTPAPIVPARKIAKPSVKVTPAEQLPSVEAKEIAMGDASDDEELSELDSDEAEELEEDEELGEEDAEGEEELGEEDAEGEDEELDSDEGTPGSDGGTPDLSKLTRRQRAVYDENLEGGLMALSNEAQKKKHLTAEELTMRRAEMARRRKNLSEKRNEEEKMDTINRLLKKQAPKRRGKATKETAADAGESGGEEVEPEVEKAPALYTHYVQNADGVSLGVPAEWLDTAFGTTFANPVKAQSSRPFTGRMVEEVS